MVKIRVLLVLALALGGCVSNLIEEQPPAVFHALDYPPPTVACRQQLPQGVKVWTLAAAPPYGRSELVVSDPGGQIAFSQSHQWVAPPGEMVAAKLIRDLSRSGIFARVADQSSPLVLPLQLTGRIYRFTWQHGEEGPKARLSVELSLADRSASRVLFHRSYQLESPPAARDDAAAFTAAMSALMQTLSQRLQRDLCQALAAGAASK